MHRRSFLAAGALSLFAFVPSLGKFSKEGYLQSVTGPVPVNEAGLVLEHEHVLVDFIGADRVSASRYNSNEAFDKILPYLLEIKKLGFTTFVECTPQFLGRDVLLLRRLAEATGLKIITNTGLYGTQNGKYLPPYAFNEIPEQLAKRWISEWQHGIEGTGIKPGFIKISVDKAPLRNFQRNLVKAAAIAHLETGLTIVSHTGEAPGALEQIEILKETRVDPSAFIWVHAKIEPDPEKHIKVAEKGAWASYDGVAWGKPECYLELIGNMKKNGYMDQVLVSHDAGWYQVGEPNGGEFKGFFLITEQLIPLLLANGYNKADIEKLLKVNPAKALAIEVRKIK